MLEAQKDFIQEKGIKIIKGNVAAAYAAKSARVQVISAYPITPQTTVVEKLSYLIYDSISYLSLKTSDTRSINASNNWN